MEITRADALPNCQNCDFEEYCNHCIEGLCECWRPDLDYRKMLDSWKGEFNVSDYGMCCDEESARDCARRNREQRIAEEN